MPPAPQPPLAPCSRSICPIRTVSIGGTRPGSKPGQLRRRIRAPIGAAAGSTTTPMRPQACAAAASTMIRDMRCNRRRSPSTIRGALCGATSRSAEPGPAAVRAVLHRRSTKSTGPRRSKPGRSRMSSSSRRSSIRRCSRRPAPWMSDRQARASPDRGAGRALQHQLEAAENRGERGAQLVTETERIGQRASCRPSRRPTRQRIPAGDRERCPRAAILGSKAGATLVRGPILCRHLDRPCGTGCIP
jgi:hypothetical protein